MTKAGERVCLAAAAPMLFVGLYLILWLVLRLAVPDSRAATVIHWRPMVLSGGAGCTVTTNAITVNLLTSFGDTSNNSFYASAAVTPSAAGATIIAFVANTPVVSTYSVTNTGTTQLSWIPVGVFLTNDFANTNYNTLASPAARLAAWITQLPPGVSPFSMRVVPQGITSGTGCNLSVLEVLGASTNQPWGLDAVQQVAMRGSNGVANPRITWAAPGNSGSNTIIMAIADDRNPATDSTAGTGFTELSETTNNTPANGLFVQYQTYVPAATTFGTNNAVARDWAGIALEIKAGTNACGYPDPPWVVPANAAKFYVDTASESAGGSGRVTNQVSGADRAFKSLKECLEHASFDTNVPRVVYCKGVTNDVNICVQTTWESVTNNATCPVWVVGDNTTGKWNDNAYKLSATNASTIYNNAQLFDNISGNIWLVNLQAEVRVTSSGVASAYNCFRLATANIGQGRRDCDLGYFGCIARLAQTGSDDAVGFIDSELFVNSQQSHCRRINCLVYTIDNNGSWTQGFIGATANHPNWYIENYNCTAVTNDIQFSDPQIIVNCLAGYDALGGGFGFTGTGNGNGLSRGNTTADTTTAGYTVVSKVYTFVNEATADFDLQSSDAGAKGVAFPYPLAWMFGTDIKGETRQAAPTAWDAGAYKVNP